MTLVESNPSLALALIIGFFCLASFFGGILRPLMFLLYFRTLLFFLLPFGAGAGGILYLLN
jgi:hypothetical protein